MAFQLAQLHVPAARKLPDVFIGAVARVGAVHLTEQVATYQLEVRQPLVAAPQVQDARVLAILGHVPQGQQRERVALAAAATAAQEHVQLFRYAQYSALEVA